MSSPHLPKLLTVVFDYSHFRRKSTMCIDPNALYRSEGVISPLTVLPPVVTQYWFFFLQSLGQTRGNAASARQRDKQGGFL